MSPETVFLLHSLKYGFGLAFLYDILRLLRLTIRHGGLMISLEDIGFWAYTAIKVFVMMQDAYNGSIRWFSVLGGLAGILLYCKIFSPVFIRCGMKVLKPVTERIGKAGHKLKCACKVPAMKMRQKAGGLKKRLTRLKKLLKMTL